MKAKQIPAAVRKALHERSEGRCERCGNERATQAHHRRPRALGGSRDAGTNVLSNLLHLGNDCHAHVESYRSEAFSYGWLCRQAMDPRQMPVERRGVWVHLGDDGGVEPVSAVGLVELSQLLGYGVEGVA